MPPVISVTPYAKSAVANALELRKVARVVDESRLRRLLEGDSPVSSHRKPARAA